MKEFHTIIKRRLLLLSFATALFILIVIVFALYGFKSESSAENYVLGMQTGVFIGVLSMTLLKINRLRSALQDEKTLKVFYIEENDERKQLIKHKANSISLQIILLVTSLVAVVSGFINVTVSITLFMVLLCLSLVLIVSKYYYNRKY